MNPSSRPEDRPDIMTDFVKTGNGGHPVPIYETLAEGLTAFGWREVPAAEGSTESGTAATSAGVGETTGVVIGSGMFGAIKLAYKASDEERVPLHQRHLAAVKVQPRDSEVSRIFGDDMLYSIEVTWTEVNILRGCAHDNIIDYYRVCRKFLHPCSGAQLILH